MESGAGPTPSAEPDLARLVEQVLVALDAGDATVLESVCRTYPARADEIRARVRAEQAERALARLLTRIEAGDPVAIDEAVREHPELEPRIRAYRSALRRIDAPIRHGDVAIKRLGDYEILREIGRGGMGVVKLARQARLNRVVALKILPPGLALDDDSVRRFTQEAQLAASFRHPHIVALHDFGEIDGTYFIAMEYIEGRSLHAVISALSGIPPEQRDGAAMLRALGVLDDAATEPPPGTPAWASRHIESSCRIVRQIADALHAAHERGIIHRDVKPSNILVGRDLRAVLTDFGLARDEGLPGLSREGTFVGTAYYVSPQQAAGARRATVDRRTDVYSLGVTLYELLTLRRPFEGASTREVLDKILSKSPVPPRRVNPQISQDLSKIVLRAMERDPERRYATAAELAQDLDSVLAMQAPSHALSSRPDPPSSSRRTRSESASEPPRSRFDRATVQLESDLPKALSRTTLKLTGWIDRCPPSTAAVRVVADGTGVSVGHVDRRRFSVSIPLPPGEHRLFFYLANAQGAQLGIEPQVVAPDGALLAEPGDEVRIVVDQTKPSLRRKDLPASTDSEVLDVDVEAHDPAGISSVILRFGDQVYEAEPLGSEGAYRIAWPLGPGDGERSAVIEAVDLAGNREAVVVEVKVDRQLRTAAEADLASNRIGHALARLERALHEPGAGRETREALARARAARAAALSATRARLLTAESVAEVEAALGDAERALRRPADASRPAPDDGELGPRAPAAANLPVDLAAAPLREVARQRSRALRLREEALALVAVDLSGDAVRAARDLEPELRSLPTLFEDELRSVRARLAARVDAALVEAARVAIADRRLVAARERIAEIEERGRDADASALRGAADAVRAGILDRVATAAREGPTFAAFLESLQAAREALGEDPALAEFAEAHRAGLRFLASVRALESSGRAVELARSHEALPAKVRDNPDLAVVRKRADAAIAGAVSALQEAGGELSRLPFDRHPLPEDIGGARLAVDRAGAVTDLSEAPPSVVPPEILEIPEALVRRERNAQSFSSALAEVAQRVAGLETGAPPSPAACEGVLDHVRNITRRAPRAPAALSLAARVDALRSAALQRVRRRRATKLASASAAVLVVLAAAWLGVHEIRAMELKWIQGRDVMLGRARRAADPRTPFGWLVPRSVRSDALAGILAETDLASASAALREPRDFAEHERLFPEDAFGPEKQRLRARLRDEGLGPEEAVAGDPQGRLLALSRLSGVVRLYPESERASLEEEIDARAVALDDVLWEREVEAAPDLATQETAAGRYRERTFPSPSGARAGRHAAACEEFLRSAAALRGDGDKPTWARVADGASFRRIAGRLLPAVVDVDLGSGRRLRFRIVAPVTPDGRCWIGEPSSGGWRTIAPFYLGENEVAWADAPDLKKTGDASDDGDPVTGILFETARRWCETKGLRLPTEEEFEMALREGGAVGPEATAPRGGRDGAPPGNLCARDSTDLLGDIEPFDWTDGYPKIAPVDNGIPPNALGLRNLFGNVAEWCERGPGGETAARGGSWASGKRRKSQLAPAPEAAYGARWLGPDGLQVGFRPAHDAKF